MAMRVEGERRRRLGVPQTALPCESGNASSPLFPGFFRFSMSPAQPDDTIGHTVQRRTGCPSFAQSPFYRSDMARCARRRSCTPPSDAGGAGETTYRSNGHGTAPMSRSIHSRSSGHISQTITIQPQATHCNMPLMNHIWSYCSFLFPILITVTSMASVAEAVKYFVKKWPKHDSKENPDCNG